MKNFILSLILLVVAIFVPIMQAVRAAFHSISRHFRAFAYIGYCHLTAHMGRSGMILYANTLTNLIPTLYEALDVVSREMVGFIPAVSRNSSAERAAVNQTINIPIVPVATTGNVTPAATPPDDGDQTIGNTTMTISNSKYSPVRWSGEEQKAVGASGVYNVVLRDQFAQSMRALVNLVEADLAALHVYASRGYGTYNTSPFLTADDMTDFAAVNQILDDNGAPTFDRQLVLGSAATAAIRGKQSSLFKVNEAGSSDLLRKGIITEVGGLGIHSSAAVKKTVAIGSSSSSAVDTAAYAIGDTVITMGSAGTGGVLAGDMVTFAGDTNVYVIATTDSAVASGTITLQEPGLRKAIAGSAAPVMTLIAATNRNMAFHRSAIQLITRAPALPDGGDMADDRMTIVDPVSGIAFEVSLYKQYRRIKYELALAWGVKAVAPRHIMNLYGPNA